MLLAIYGWGAYERDKNTCARTLAESGGAYTWRGVTMVLIKTMKLPAPCTRTCIPLTQGTSKYNLKVRATPAKVKFGKGRFAQLKSPILVYVYLSILLGLSQICFFCLPILQFCTLLPPVAIYTWTHLGLYSGKICECPGKPHVVKEQLENFCISTTQCKQLPLQCFCFCYCCKEN